MEIIKVEYKGILIPKSSCGTGYSEPYIYELTNKYNCKYKIYIDIWYKSNNQISNTIQDEIKNYSWKIDNINFVYNEIYKDILKRINQ